MPPARFRILIGAIGALALSACDDRALSMNPPKIIQLNCQPDNGGRPMVFVIDTGLQEAVWANAEDAPKVRATITKREYLFEFSSPASQLTINRYDGIMTLIHGSGPPLSGRCSRTKTGASL